MQDQSWIDDEADFVDEVILQVGKRENANTAVTDSFNRDFVLLLAKPELQKQLPAAHVTPEGWVEFAGKFFTGLSLPQDVLKSKSRRIFMASLTSVLHTSFNFSLAVTVGCEFCHLIGQD